MVEGASITVNTSKNDGILVEGKASSETNTILKNILKELQNINATNYSNTRKQESGLSLAGGLGAFGLIAGLIGAGPSIAAGAGNLSQDLGRTARNLNPLYDLLAGQGNTFAKVDMGNGETKYAEIDTKTGVILDFLTKEEALRRGIVDETGTIYDNLDATKQNTLGILGSATKVKDTYILTDAIVLENYRLLEQQKLQNEEITRLNQAIIDKLKKKGGKTALELNRNMSISDEAYEAEVRAAEVSRRQSIDRNTYKPDFFQMAGTSIAELQRQRALTEYIDASKKQGQSNAAIFNDLLGSNLNTMGFKK